MPRPTKRRQLETAPSHKPITDFTRVSKASALPIDKTVSTSRKRKAVDDDTSLARRTVSFAPSSDEDEAQSQQSKRACRRDDVSVPAPTTSRPIKARKLAQPAQLRSPRQQRKKIQTKISAYGRKDATTESKNEDALPPHLLELVTLHRAFLKTAMLQFAHIGHSAPLDLRTFLPHLSQAWGKRRATVDDIRRCIAVETSATDPSPFVVADYGRGKVCIELRGTVNEDGLCRRFEENLRGLAAKRPVDNDAMDVDIPLGALSISDVPQAAVEDMQARAAENPEMAKGHRALAELKNGNTARQEKKDAAAAKVAAFMNPDGSKMGLLDRLRIKALVKAEGPLPPSGPELQRRAALNRVADVAATLSMLSLSSATSLPRQAFTMAMIQEKLKDSMCVPISREEGADCVRLIAKEVAPQWLMVVTAGGRENVVIMRGGQPVDRVLEERVRRLLG